MRILILGINHAPELVGIGPYTAEMARWLAKAGHAVEVVTAKPYYPDWAVAPEYRRFGYARSIENDVRVVRCPLYVPAAPSGHKRLLHHLSFALAALPPVLTAIVKRRPHLVFTIAPSLASVPVARFAAWIARARNWLHIQDFEVGAAIAMGLVTKGSLAERGMLAMEAVSMTGFDRYSTISPQMCARLRGIGIPKRKIVEFRNWSDIAAVVPLSRPSVFRARWNITTPHVALYSGNIANKQGVDIIVDTARALRHRTDLTFVVCGEGPTREALVASARDLPNIRFHPLQPQDQIGELLGLATIHLLPQLGSAADLVLPSKLTNMLASGRPVVATALPGTGLADEVSGCGVITPPGDVDAFAAAITDLIDDPAAHIVASRTARSRAEGRWSKQSILSDLEREIDILMVQERPIPAIEREATGA